jgi:hypothetical protein
MNAAGQARTWLAAATALAALAFAPGVRADETPRPRHMLEGIAGLAYTFPRFAADSQSGYAVGLFLAAEYVRWPGSWFTPRAYYGITVTASGRAFCTDTRDLPVAPCDVGTQAAFAGVKVRLMAPIPYVGPFIELGIGGSLGFFHMRIGNVVDREHAGVTPHFPFAVGLALGREHKVDLTFSYLLHPGTEQLWGGVGIGLGVPLP